MRSVIFSLIKTEEIIRSLSCKNPFCAIVKGLRLFKASEEQIPTAMSEETTKRVNYHKNGNLPLFCIEKDTRVGVLYAPFACVLMVHPGGLEPPAARIGIWCAIQLRHGCLHYYIISFLRFCHAYMPKTLATGRSAFIIKTESFSNRRF